MRGETDRAAHKNLFLLASAQTSGYRHVEGPHQSEEEHFTELLSSSLQNSNIGECKKVNVFTFVSIMMR